MGTEKKRARLRLPSLVFVDTGAWHAVSVPGDNHHQQAVLFYRALLEKNTRLLTTNLVVAETHAGLTRARDKTAALKFLTLIGTSSRVQIINSTFDLENQAQDLLRKYHDQRFSLCDAVSFAIMQDLGIKDAFTFDRHFETAGFRRLPK